MINNSSILRHFLDFNLWEEALKLLNFQIACQEDNKHFLSNGYKILTFRIIHDIKT